MISASIARRKPTGSKPAAPRKPEAKSRVSNGRDVLPNVDGRSLIARRYRDIASAILLDQGGIDQCSEQRQQLIRRFAACSVISEQAEAALARGEKIDISEHSLLCSTLTRLAQRIGIDRIAKNIPSVSDYIASLQHKQAAEEDAA
jgi:hypothetical protein